VGTTLLLHFLNSLKPSDLERDSTAGFVPCRHCDMHAASAVGSHLCKSVWAASVGHKASTGCTGKRKHSEFVALKDFDDRNLLRGEHNKPLSLLF